MANKGASLDDFARLVVAHPDDIPVLAEKLNVPDIAQNVPICIGDGTNLLSIDRALPGRTINLADKADVRSLEESLPKLVLTSAVSSLSTWSLQMTKDKSTKAITYSFFAVQSNGIPANLAVDLTEPSSTIPFELVVSGKRSSFSCFKILSSPVQGYYLIYNPRTACFLRSGAKAADGTAGVLLAPITLPTPLPTGSLSDLLKSQALSMLGPWLWKFEARDNGPQTDLYHFIHSDTGKLLSSANPDPVTATQKSVSTLLPWVNVSSIQTSSLKLEDQPSKIETTPSDSRVWSVEAVISNHPTYNVIPRQGAAPLFSKPTTSTASIPPSLRIMRYETLSGDLRFLIYHLATDNLPAGFLGHNPSPNLGTLNPPVPADSLVLFSTIVQPEAGASPMSGKEDIWLEPNVLSMTATTSYKSAFETAFSCLLWEFKQAQVYPNPATYQISASESGTHDSLATDDVANTDKTAVYTDSSPNLISDFGKTLWDITLDASSTWLSPKFRISHRMSGRVLQASTGINVSVSAASAPVTNPISWIVSARLTDPTNFTLSPVSNAPLVFLSTTAPSPSASTRRNAALDVQSSPPWSLNLYELGRLVPSTLFGDTRLSTLDQSQFVIVHFTTGRFLQSPSSVTNTAPTAALWTSPILSDSSYWSINTTKSTDSSSTFFTLSKPSGGLALSTGSGNIFGTMFLSAGMFRITRAGPDIYKIRDVASSLYISQDDISPGAVVLRDDNGLGNAGWRILDRNTLLSGRQLVPKGSSTMGAITSSSAPAIMSGLYTIEHLTSGLALALSNTTSVAGQTLGLPVQLSTPASATIWYISKDAVGCFVRDVSRTGKYLSSGDQQTALSASGEPVWLLQRYAYEKSMLWNFTKTTGGYWTIQSIADGSALGGPGGVVPQDGTPVLLQTQSIRPNEKANQSWRLKRFRIPISSGFYRIVGDTNILSWDAGTRKVDTASPSTLGYGVTWYFENSADGSFVIRTASLTGFLSVVESKTVQGNVADSISRTLQVTDHAEADHSRWVVQQLFNANSFMLTNAATNFLLTVPPTTNPLNMISLVRVDQSASCFEDWPSAMIPSAYYNIQEVSSGNYLSIAASTTPSFSRITKNIQIAVTSPSLAFVIKSTNDGYYVILREDGTGTLCHENGLLGTTDAEGTTSTRWKLLLDVSGAYLIVNKETGQLLTLAPNGTLTCTIDARPLAGQLWKLDRLQRPGNPVPLYQPRKELRLANGVYLMAALNSGWFKVDAVTSNDFAKPVQTFDPSATDATSALFAFETIQDQGWFTIMSMTKGALLSCVTGGRLIWDQDWRSKPVAGSLSSHWKVLTESNGSPNTYQIIINRVWPVSLQWMSGMVGPFTGPVTKDYINRYAFITVPYTGELKPSFSGQVSIVPGVYFMTTTSTTPTTPTVSAPGAAASTGTSSEGGSSVAVQALTAFDRPSNIGMLNFDSLHSGQLFKIQPSTKNFGSFQFGPFWPSGRFVRIRDRVIAVPLEDVAAFGDNADWIVEKRSDGTYAFMTLDSKLQLVYAPNPPVTLNYTSVTNGPMAAFSPFALGTWSSTQTWRLTRTGYYIRNLGVDNSKKLTAANRILSALPQPTIQDYVPFARAPETIWHLAKWMSIDYPWDTDPKFVLYNESLSLPLCTNAIPPKKDAVLSDTDVSGAGPFLPSSSSGATHPFPVRFSKDGGFLQISLLNQNAFLAAPMPGAGSNTCTVNRFKSVDQSQRSWELCSITSVDANGIVGLPRTILVSNVAPGLDKVLSLADGKSSIQGYQKGMISQRFRQLRLGSRSLWLSETNNNLVYSFGSGGAIDITHAGTDEWADSDKLPNGFQSVSVTGDVDVEYKTYRIRMQQTVQSLGQFLTWVPNNSTMIVSDLDVNNDNQLWRIQEWGGGRYIVHVNTSRCVTVPSGLSDANHPPALFQVDWSDKGRLSGFRPIWVESQDPATKARNYLMFSDPLNTVRFIRTSTDRTLCGSRQQLEVFLKANAPIFVHDKLCGAAHPTNVATYLAHANLARNPPPNPNERHLILPNLWETSYLPDDELDSARPYFIKPISDPSPDIAALGGPMVYVTVQPHSDPDYPYYTDITYYLFYSNSPNDNNGMTAGWKSVTCCYNNTTQHLESIFTNSELGWTQNLDGTVTLSTTTTNQLKILTLKTDKKVKLHLYVDSTMTPHSKFDNGIPPSSTKWNDPKNPTDIEINDYITDTSNWGLVFDAGTAFDVIQADMLIDDESGGRPIRQNWMDFKGYWDAPGAFLNTNSSSLSVRF